MSHAGAGLLRETAAFSGLVEAVTEALIDTCAGILVHAPGQVFADLAVAVADGADAIGGIVLLGDRPELFGPVASLPRAWWLLERLDDAHLAAVAQARAQACAAAWAARAAPPVGRELVIDIDATITIAHSEKQNAAATWKPTFGFHPLLAFLDRPEIAGGRRWSGWRVRVTPGRTPPPTTSRSWSPRWPSCRPAINRTPLARRGFWCAATPPAPPTRSPRTPAPAA